MSNGCLCFAHAAYCFANLIDGYQEDYYRIYVHDKQMYVPFEVCFVRHKNILGLCCLTFPFIQDESATSPSYLYKPGRGVIKLISFVKPISILNYQSEMKRLNYILIFLSIALGACSQEEGITPDANLQDLTLVTQSSIPNTQLSVKVYQYTQHAFVGYNKLEFLVEKEGASDAYEQATITLHPLMDMGNMTHSCPVEQPIKDINFKKAYGGAVVFVMPSGPTQTWTLTINVSDAATGEAGEINLPMEVYQPNETAMKSFTMSGDPYFVSLVAPFDPQVGMNELEFAIHQKKSMMDWPASAGFNITMVPEMPEMGHSSPNNVDPVYEQNGHYVGQVNFTMDGHWRLNLQLEKDGSVQDLSFDITFESNNSK